MKYLKKYSRFRFFLFFLFGLLLPGILPAQDLVRDQGITSPLHKAHTGRIVFTDKPMHPAALKPGDFLRSYVLTNKTNLFITAFLAHSLTNYMHRLAPELPADSLHKLGGYRFSLFIDGRLIYESDIAGAPLPMSRDTETVVSKPLIDNDHEGRWWSQFFWMRFMANGGDSALTEGSHLLKLEIRPQVRAVAGEVIAAGELPLQVNRKPVIDVSRIRLSKIKPYPGLPVSAEGFDRNKIKELKGKIEAAEFRKINGIVVIKNGKLLIEEYFNGANRQSLHDTRSVGKTFASAITGIAIGEGYLKSENQTLKEFYQLQAFDHYAAAKEQISLKDLLTMRAAFDGDDEEGDSPGNEENMYPTANWVQFTLDLPVSATRPRDQWHYFTAGVVLLGDILQKVVPGGLEQYADQRLFAPLGLQYRWEYTPQRVPNTAGGIRLNALDLAKFGQLYKNGGQWNGQPVLPAAWVAKSLTKHLPVRGRPNEYYGYLFWNKEYVVNGRRYETYYCSGNGGNKVFVFKDQPLVVVITASAYGQPYAHWQADRMMADFILPAVLE